MQQSRTELKKKTYSKIADSIFHKTLRGQPQLIEHIHQYEKAYCALYGINFG